MTDRSDSEDSSPENARASRHSILATKYQPTTTRATPDAIRDELRKLSPPSSAEARRALFTLAHALAHVQPYHEREVCAVCLQEGAVAALLELLLVEAVREPVAWGAAAAPLPEPLFLEAVERGDPVKRLLAEECRVVVFIVVLKRIVAVF